MLATYIRLFTDEHGTSRFEERSIQLEKGFAVPPAEPLHVGQFLPTDGSF